MRRALRKRFCCIVAALLGAHATARGDSAEEIDDAATRIQYAYYTADPQALEEATAKMEGFKVDGDLAALKAYYLAYGRWRLAELYATQAERSAASAHAARACSKHAAAAIAAQGSSAEAHALHAVCRRIRTPADVPGAAPHRKARAGRCHAKSLRTALALAAENPRVRLIDALCAAEPADVATLRSAVAAFEAAPPRTTHAPEWGHAEALAMLGRSCLAQGDPVGARDALERALAIAPDYREAQALLEIAAARPQ